MDNGKGTPTPAFLLQGLASSSRYCFSTWVKVEGINHALIRASLQSEKETYDCIGTVTAQSQCWSFLKGGFVLKSPSNASILFFQSSGSSSDFDIRIESSSLQPFTVSQWRTNQQLEINRVRKRMVTIHMSNVGGEKLIGADVAVKQVSRDFPFGSAIASTIIGNSLYQGWFKERFNVAVFENELKWYVTEPERGKPNYTLADEMLEVVRSNRLTARGHNVFWEDERYTPGWVRDLSGPDLESAVDSRVWGLMGRYRGEFAHWDVSNELLHFDFYETRLGPSASSRFFRAAHESDPLAALFVNDFNVVETCTDLNSTVDLYISKLKDLGKGVVGGIGLESHFVIPNPPLVRAVLDKLGTLDIPLWLTEVDISSNFDRQTQAVYLEEVVREGFSHPSVEGMILWAALRRNGCCYQMCLTDTGFQNLPAGDSVDRLLAEWTTGAARGVSDGHGLWSFSGFLGEYELKVTHLNVTVTSPLSLTRGQETLHFTILV